MTDPIVYYCGTTGAPMLSFPPGVDITLPKQNLETAAKSKKVLFRYHDNVRLARGLAVFFVQCCYSRMARRKVDR